MKLPKFSMEFNLGHVLVAISLVGSMLGVFRASEIRGVQTQEQLNATRELLHDEIAERRQFQKEQLQLVHSIALQLERMTARQEAFERKMITPKY